MSTIITEELAKAGDAASAATVIKGEEVLEEMKAGGMVVNDVNPDDFKALTAGVYDELGLAEARAELQPFIDAAK